MARSPRINSCIGIEHVMLRGLNRQLIFFDDADKAKFLKCLREAREKAEFTLFAYCLMDNHVHLLIRKKKEPIGDTVKRFAVSYTAYFNKKYDHVGPLFQGRFKNVPVEREDQFLRTMRYIFQNPVHANICEKASDYRWSNCRSLGTDDGLADSRLVNRLAEPEYIREFLNANAPDVDIEIALIEKTRIADMDVASIMKEVSGMETAEAFLRLDDATRAKYIRRMMDRGCKCVQIMRLLGVTKYQFKKMRMGK